ncbi:MAG: right-handed parallel beta-helix repeat-containing protein [Methanosarcina barkeri]|nr:right-handed parallel beta-helix repeat-containing protein [Methanosarcina sp. ERenArc_MAG2]
MTILGNDKENQTSGIFLDNVSNSLIQNNIISSVQDGLVLAASSENSIKNNTLFSNNLHGIYLINSMNNDLKNNFIIGNKRGLYLDQSNRNTLADNNASGNEKYGIALLDSNTNNLTNNQFYMNKYGLCLTDSHENVIIDNTASDNKESGFLLFLESSYNNVEGNLLIENKNSGMYLASCSNNTLSRNSLSNNNNGISIDVANDNLIINNTFSSNKEYGLFYPHLGSNNTIKDNIFLNNKKGNDNLSSTPIYVILILLTGTGLAYYLKKKSLLKKALIGLSILIAIFLVAIIAWYFPFEANTPANNVEITNFSWHNSSVINETYTQVTLSMDINYRHKEAYCHTFNENSQTDMIPIKLHISLNSYGTATPLTLLSEENINLTYQKPFKYETTLDLKNNVDYNLVAIPIFKEEFDYPFPYGESRWGNLGGIQLIST